VRGVGRQCVRTRYSGGTSRPRISSGLSLEFRMKGAMLLMQKTSASSGVDTSCMRIVHELCSRRSSCCPLMSTRPATRADGWSSQN